MNRIYHRYEKWECFKAGFYNQSPPDGMTDNDCRNAYRDHLRDLDVFQSGIDKVFSEWRHSCEHFLTNENINRIAWLGQASMCILTGVPSKYRGGFFLLSPTEQTHANRLSEYNIKDWLFNRRNVQAEDQRVHRRVGAERLFEWNS